MGKGPTGTGGVQRRQAEAGAIAHFGSRCGEALAGVIGACTEENRIQRHQEAGETRLSVNSPASSRAFPFLSGGIPRCAATDILILLFVGTHLPYLPLGRTGPVHGGGWHDQRFLLA